MGDPFSMPLSISFSMTSHRLQDDEKALLLRLGFRLRAYERFAETSRRDWLQAM